MGGPGLSMPAGVSALKTSLLNTLSQERPLKAPVPEFKSNNSILASTMSGMVKMSCIGKNQGV